MDNKESTYSDVELLAKIQKLCDLFDEVDELVNSNGDRLKNVDYRLSDIEHTMENEELTDSEMLNLSKKLKELRKIRRGLKNEYEIIKEFNRIKNRILEENNRKIFKTNISITMRNLNQPYKNRVYTEEEITEIKCLSTKTEITNENISIEKINEEPKKRGRKSKIDLDILIEEYKKGKKQSELAKMFNCSQPSVHNMLQKMGIIKKDNKKHEEK